MLDLLVAYYSMSPIMISVLRRLSRIFFYKLVKVTNNGSGTLIYQNKKRLTTSQHTIYRNREHSSPSSRKIWLEETRPCQGPFL